MKKYIIIGILLAQACLPYQMKAINNHPIVLKEFYTTKPIYGIGEKLSLVYSQEEANEKEIVGQKWQYRNLSLKGPIILGKPKYFKQPGLYEIALSVQDKQGNWSNKVSCQVRVSEEIVQRNGYYLFQKGIPGDLIEGYIDKDYNHLQTAQVTQIKDVPGVLMMSNSPETVYREGILYQDTVEGRGRLVLHHKNGTATPKKLLVTVTNTGSKEEHLVTTQGGIQGPGEHVATLGQSAVMAYLEGDDEKEYKIGPGQTVCVYSSWIEDIWKNKEVVTGTIDFESQGPLTWQVAMLDINKPMMQIADMEILPRDSHDRGTFSVIERHYELQLEDIVYPQKIVLGKESKEWLKGIDATTGQPAQNRGNYGLPIKMTFRHTQEIGVILNARGGAYKGGIKWNHQKIFKVPREQVLKQQEIAALVGSLKKNTKNEITYMLPNGSSAPLLFGFIPQSMW